MYSSIPELFSPAITKLIEKDMDGELKFISHEVVTETADQEIKQKENLKITLLSPLAPTILFIKKSWAEEFAREGLLLEIPNSEIFELIAIDFNSVSYLNSVTSENSQTPRRYFLPILWQNPKLNKDQKVEIKMWGYALPKANTISLEERLKWLGVLLSDKITYIQLLKSDSYSSTIKSMDQWSLPSHQRPSSIRNESLTGLLKKTSQSEKK